MQTTYKAWNGKSLSLKDSVRLQDLKDQGKTNTDEYKKLKEDLQIRAKVQAAHVRFVEESVVRPNSAHRPVWASDPRAMLFWHLKSFFYSYGKIIVAPFLGEMQKQIAAAGQGKQGVEAITLYGKQVAVQALPLVFAGVLLFGLAALGWEAREMIQYAGGEGRTDKMEWDQYVSELAARSGVWGPFELAGNLAFDYGDADRRTARLLGPTFDWFMTMAKSDWDQKLFRSLPIVNQMPVMKDALSF